MITHRIKSPLILYTFIYIDKLISKKIVLYNQRNKINKMLSTHRRWLRFSSHHFSTGCGPLLHCPNIQQLPTHKVPKDKMASSHVGITKQNNIIS